LIVYGSGLLANKFKDKKSGLDFCIFASGVSNSGEIRESEFQREKELFLDCCSNEKSIIYFSSCSVELREEFWTPYIQHKYEMEQSIISSGAGIVVRLPNVVGRGGNKNTLFNYICRSILSGDIITLRNNAVRSLIDIDDVVSLVTFLCGNGYFDKLSSDKLIRLTLPNQFSVEDIIVKIESHYGMKARIEYSGEDFLYVDKSELVEECIENGIISYDSNYLWNLVRKYA
jgi:nucleoside-diphosphate-sugar epimerase